MPELGQLFKQALDGAVGATAAVFDYGDTEDFSRLWGTDEQGVPTVLADVNGKQAIIIVWDGRKLAEDDPTANLLAPHLTPLDWALAFSIKVLGGSTFDEQRNFQIHVIDLTGKVHDEWAMRMRHQLLVEMPWLTLHAPLIPKTAAEEKATYRVGYLSILEPGGLLEQSGAWALRVTGKALVNHKTHGKDLSELAKQWVASLTQSDDHHDINNVIGADILSTREGRRRGLFGAFLTRLTWSGHEIETLGNWVPWDADGFRDDLFARPLYVLIVDDQIQQGWDRFVCRLLGNQKFDKNCSYRGDQFTKLNANDRWINVHGSPSSEPLVSFLEKDAVFDRREYHSQVMGQGHSEPNPEIILLDLRLYPEMEKARTQAKRLLDIVRQKAQGSLAWKAIDPGEVERIKCWCERGGQDQRVADEALLLLPRLLALALPLTPIILFSSTGRSWIRERLKPYQNIFTGFEKPRVLSDQESVTASVAALREGLSKAVGMMRLRLQLAHAQSAAALASKDRPDKGSRFGRNHHIEIYADETGTLEQGITSGMAVCVFQRTDAAENLQRKLFEEFKKSGLVWARRVGGDEPVLHKGSAIRGNNIYCKTEVTSLNGLLENVSLGVSARTLWSVVATRVEGRNLSPRNVSLDAFPDAPLDKALRFNLEFTLYVLIPYYSSSDDENLGTVDIRLPTRIVPYDTNNDANKESFVTQLCKAFDLGRPVAVRRPVAVEDAKNSMAISTSSIVPTGNGENGNIGFGNAFPLVRGWLHEWLSACPDARRQIVSIKLTSLGRGERGISIFEASQRRLFHDIADWVCTASCRYQRRKPSSEKKEWIKEWIDDPLRTELKEQSVFPRWYISTDASHNNYKLDTENAVMLLRAIKTSFICTVGRSGEGDVLRLILRNTYVNGCNTRLSNTEYCAQQRLILWKLRHEIDYAQGRTLHMLLTEDNVQPLDSSELASGDLSGEATCRLEQSMVGPADGAGPSEQVLLQESDSDAVIPQTIPTTVQLPEILVEEDLRARFPTHGVYEVVSFTKHGTVFCKPKGAGGNLGTHLVQDKGLVLQLRADGWARPLIVFGIENNVLLNRSEKGLRVLAAKLTDSRWKIIGSM